MIYFLISICCIFCAIIIILCLIISKNKSQIEQMQNTFLKMDSSKAFFQKEVHRLQNQIKILEKKEIEELIATPLKINGEQRKYSNIFKGKKAIIGNYDTFSREQTRKMLQNFGLSVDTVTTGVELYEKITNGYKYDIIFTNNIYQIGYNGKQLLHNLKSLDGFNTPIVVHTISTNQREKFINDIGFDEYLEKPIKFTELEKVLKKFLL